MSHSLPETETRNIRYRSACQRRQRYRFSGTSDQCCMAIYTSCAVSPERRCSTHHAEAEIWRHYSDTSWRLTLAACPSANNVQVVYHCLYKRLHCRHETASSHLTEVCVPIAASTGRRCLRSAARGDLMDHAVLQSPDHVSGMICHWLCVLHPPHLDSSRAD